MESKPAQFASRLLTWHEQNRFSFPWRLTSDPYRILVSELLLRKTAREQVNRIYDKFFLKFPDFETLNNSDMKGIQSAIRTLGMQVMRANALKKISAIIIDEHAGRVPRKEEDLLALPHVGLYISNAVLCFAFGEDMPLLDTNVVRVVSRVFSFRSRKKRAREDPELWKAVKKMIPRGKAKGFNLAMLDFAASVCTLKNPKCSICPMLSICDYGQSISN